MSNVLRRFGFKHVPGACLVCRRQAFANGVTYPRGQMFACVCADPHCLAVAERLLFMAPAQFNAIESNSIMDAGDKAGAYLDQIGKSDLATLDQDEWRQFLFAFTYALEEAMRVNALRSVYGEDWQARIKSKPTKEEITQAATYRGEMHRALNE